MLSYLQLECPQMRNLSRALAVTLAYVETRTNDCTEDDDLRALENAGAFLDEATEDEREALAEAFEEIGKPKLIEGFGLN